MKHFTLSLACAMAVATTGASSAHAQGLHRHHADPSAASSALSMLPVAVSLVAPSAVLSAGVALTVVAVDASVDGTVWLLERVSDGVRLSLNVAGQASLAAGTLVVVSAVGTGWILSQAGRAVCFVPNASGTSLLYNERVTR